MSYDSNAVSPRSPTTTVRDRDEGSPWGANTAPLRRALRGWWSPKKPPLIHRDGVGGRLPVNVQVDAAWKSLEMKARSPDKFMDVSDAMVLTKMGLLSNCMTINAKYTLVKEGI